MNERERILVGVVGLCLLVMAAFFGTRKYNEAIRARKQQIAAAEKAVRDKNLILQLSTEPAARLEDYQRRSLPGDLERARSLYQTWLLNLVKDVGFQDTQVSVTPARNEKGIYHVLGFSVSGRGNLPKLVSFLHRFYSADLLHRVRRVYAKRVPGSKHLDLAIAIDAVSLPTADSTDKLNEAASRPLAHGSLEAYLETILARNLSGPANKEPAIDVPRELKNYVGDTVSFTVKAQDPDKLDQVSYSIQSGDLADAKIDRRSGEFHWPASKTGEYEVVVAATDDGFPPKTVEQKVKIRIDERPPDAPAPPPSVPKPSFDLAKFAFVTAITEVDGKRQAWISMRAEGKLLKLFEGDEFQVGQVTVKVTRIDEKAVELDAPVLERRLQVSLGQNLTEGRDLTAPGT